MKLQTVFMLVLFVAIVFALVGGVISDFATYYPEANVSNDITSKYDYSKDIKGSFGKIQTSIENIESEQSGWKPFFQTVVVIPQMITTAIIAILKSPILLYQTITEIAIELKMPSVIINVVLPIVLIMITGLVIFMLIKFWHRSSGV